MDGIVSVGLAVAFWAALFTTFDASPQWMKNLRNTKPFGCSICTSFWISIIYWTAYWVLVLEGSAFDREWNVSNILYELLQYAKQASTTTMISIVVLATYDRLRTVFLTK